MRSPDQGVTSQVVSEWQNPLGTRDFLKPTGVRKVGLPAMPLRPVEASTGHLISRRNFLRLGIATLVSVMIPSSGVRKTANAPSVAEKGAFDGIKRFYAQESLSHTVDKKTASLVSQSEIPFGVLTAAELRQNTSLRSVIESLESQENGVENFVSGILQLENGRAVAQSEKGSYIKLGIPTDDQTGNFQEVLIPLVLFHSRGTSYSVYVVEGNSFEVHNYSNPQEAASLLKEGSQILAWVPFSSPTTDLQWVGSQQSRQVSTGPSHVLIILPA